MEASEVSELLARLTEERDQLQSALETRVVIEQAKGVLAERYELSIDDAFLLLRHSARCAQMKIHLLAEQVVSEPATPTAIIRGIARTSRWRAAAIRERSEATVGRTRELHAAHVEQMNRVKGLTRAIVRVRAATRWDALALGTRVGSYRWYLVAPDDRHWDVAIELTPTPDELPHDLREQIGAWVAERGLQPVTVFFGDTELTLP